MIKKNIEHLVRKILHEALNSLELENPPETTSQDSELKKDVPDSSVKNIMCIQTALKNAGFGDLLGTSGQDGDGVDGKFGRLTRNAVIKYQEKFQISIPGTGFVGPITAEKMGCKRLLTSKDKTQKNKVGTAKSIPVRDDKTKDTKIEDAKTTIKCPSIANSPSFRYVDYMVKYWQSKYPNFKTKQEVINFIDRMIQRDAETYLKNKLSNVKVACEAASVGRRPYYDDKYIFVIDSPNKQIFLYDTVKNNAARRLIANDVMIDGLNKQRNDALSIAKAFLTLEQDRIKLKKELGREPTEDEVYDVTTKNKTRFLPAGVYSGDKTRTDTDYAGGKNNILWIKNWEGKDISQAIHGYYKGDRRVRAMNKAMSIVKNPNDPKQIQEFLKELKSGGLNMDWSYGCINVTERFVPYIRKYGPNSFIFNISEDNENYLVKDSENFFEKQMSSEECLSPTQFQSEKISDIA